MQPCRVPSGLDRGSRPTPLPSRTPWRWPRRSRESFPSRARPCPSGNPCGTSTFTHPAEAAAGLPPADTRETAGELDRALRNRVELHLPPALERLREGHFIRVLEVAADR